MTKSSRSGFTLVELMVVAVIVAILAAVAIPLMAANKKRAMATEAEAALGTVRTAFRTMYAETGAYNKNSDGTTIAASSAPDVLPGIDPGDLNGRYFSHGNYQITSVSSNAYVVTATGTGDVANVVITIDQGGGFTRSGL